MFKMVLKAREIREFTKEERYEKLEELKRELMHERGVAAMGGSPPSPGKIRQLRTSIARMLTIMHEKGEQ
jgi:large subunit ribosomal protein L29